MAFTLRLYLCFMLLFCGRVAFAQVSYYNFNAGNGLPSNEVYCAYQDNEGYLWFGTDHGIARYDGHEFKLFTTENGLTDNTVFLIRQGPQGLIWCLTFAGGICYYDGKIFRPHPLNDTIIALTKKNTPMSWSITNNKTLWLGFSSLGIFKIGENSVKAFNHVAKLSPGQSPWYTVAAISNGDHIYASTAQNENVQINDPDVEWLRSFQLPGAPIAALSRNFSLALLANKSIILGQHNHVVLVDSNMHLSQLTLSVEKDITFCRQRTGTSAWALVENGKSLCVEQSGTSVKLIDSLTLTNAASGILTDKQNNFWVTTLNAGIFMVPNYNIKILNISSGGNNNRAFSFGKFGGKLYVGLAQNSYYVLDSTLHGSFHEGISQPAEVHDFALDNKGNVRTNVDLSFGINFYTRNVVNIDDKRLLGCGAYGVIITNPQLKIIYRSDDAGFKKRVDNIARVSSDRFILASNSGLFYLDISQNYAISAEPYLKNLRITSCRVLNDSVFAVATRGKGIYIHAANRFYSVNTAKGLNSDLDEDIYFESDSVLWVASFKGVARVYFKVTADSLYTRIKCYSREDGLCSNQVNSITGYNGYLWLATNEGICYFKPSDLKRDSCNIPVYFSNIFINGQRRNADSLDLNYDENNPLIEFRGLFYQAVSGITYKVRLAGREPWKYTNQNFVQYFNLSPGKYELEVAAEDKFGKYWSNPISLKFTIRPKFTGTLFFRVAMALMALLIIATIVFLLFRNLRLRSQNYIDLLKSEFKALNYQINPHFIFNVLNSIQYYILRKDSEKAVHFLNSFSTLIRRIVTNSRQQYISIIEEVECLKEYMDLEKLRLDDKFDYEINIESHLDIESKMLLPMIIQPIVENAIWHGIVPGGTIGKVKVGFRKEGGALLVRVEDNGVGLAQMGQPANKSPQHLSMAMSNVRERLKIIGDLNDSTWYIQMVDKKRDLGLDESGAVITIRFPEIKMD